MAFDPTKQVERRRYARTSFSAELLITSPGGQPPCRGHSIDVSRGGIGFFSDRFLDPGTRAQITILTRRRGEPVTAVVPATIRWCRFDEAGAIAGAEFDDAISPSTHPELCECVDEL